MTVVLAALALIASPTAEDESAARQHYERGAVLYGEGKYAEAVGEFEAANAIRPSPDLGYNVAKALDRLGRWEAAVGQYERYLREQPGSADAAEIRARVAELRGRAQEAKAVVAAQPAPPAAVEAPRTPPARRPRPVAPGIVAAAALAFVGVGAGLAASARADFSALSGSCSPYCQPSSWAGLPGREAAGWATLGMGAVAAAVDVVLWVKWRRR
jgi:tetratricopeptide (TPR) repeat protein